MPNQEFNYEETARVLAAEREKLLRIRESIERCEFLPQLSTMAAIEYHRPTIERKPLT